jgi:hypothetical protein
MACQPANERAIERRVCRINRKEERKRGTVRAKDEGEDEDEGERLM